MSIYKFERGSHRWFSAAAIVLGLVLVVVLLSPANAANSQSNLQLYLETLPETLSYTLNAPEYEIVTNEEGTNEIKMDGFYPYGLPGDPELPAALYYIALPPLVPLDSVTLEISAVEQTELVGPFQITPFGPYLNCCSEGPNEDWGPNAVNIVDGKNTEVYDEDAFYPAQPVELAAVSQMRKWRIAELRFWPASYNPVSGRLRLTTKVTITLRYDAPVVLRESLAELQDTLMNDRAAEMFLNFSEAQSWYSNIQGEQLREQAAKPGYAIITTKRIVAASTMLDDFVSHKRSLGFRVQIVTEDDYGTLTGQAPNERPEKVRAWLKRHYKKDHIEYVLLIGNPDPLDPDKPGDKFGDMPMKMLWGDTPTDFYFAGLDGNWDEYDKFDWQADVYVGRIPVYQSDVDWLSTLDHILKKTIDYETSSDKAWRRSALLPMASLFIGRTPVRETAILAERMKADYLDRAGFTSHRMYWHGVISNSIYDGDEELIPGSVRARWQSQPFGIVVWQGHGAGENGVGTRDVNSDLNLGNFISSSDSQFLDDTRPALTFQASCSTGYPEDSKNLGYSLLKRGAVGTVSGTRDTNAYYDEPSPDSTDNPSFAYNYAKRIVSNEPLGMALFASKNNRSYITNALAYNLYGDPSIRLLDENANEVRASSLEIIQSTSDTLTNTPLLDRLYQEAQTNSGNQPNIIINDDGLTPPINSSPVLPSAISHQLDLQPTRHPESALSMGFDHGCRLRSDANIACWGGSIVEGAFTQVSTGLDHACGLRNDGSVHCWGNSAYSFGQIADHTGPFIQISTNYIHNCGLKPDGRVECWGNDQTGQLTAPDDTFVQVSAGMQSSCGLRPDGSVNCWGKNSFGQADDQAGPFVQISAGYFHTCGLRADGSIHCWGANHLGQAVDQAGPFTQVTTGIYHTCGLKIDGSTQCWGGTGSYASFYTEDRQGPFVQISAGKQHTCGLRSDGGVECWGAWFRPSLALDDRYDVRAGQTLFVNVPGLLANDLNADGSPSVYFLAEVDSKIQIHEMARIPKQNLGPLSESNVTALGKGLPVVGHTLSVVTDKGSPRIYYFDQGQHIHELSWNGEWSDSDVTVLAKASQADSLSSLASTSVNSEPRVYYLATDQHVHELAWTSGKWHHRDLTEDASAPLSVQAGPLSVTTITNGDPRVFYVTLDQHIHELAYRSITGVWTHGDLTAISGAPPLSGKSLSSTTVNSLARVYYLGTDQHVYELNWGKDTGYRWAAVDVTAQAGAMSAYPGSALASITVGTTNEPRVYYFAQGEKGLEVRELAWSNTYEKWRDNDIMAQAGGPPAVESSELSATSFKLLPRVFYLGDGQRVHELTLLLNKWTAIDVTDSGNGTTTIASSPLVTTSAGLGPFTRIITPTLVSQANHGFVTITGPGSFEYEPEDKFTGLDSFTYAVGDGFVSTTATVTLDVVNECAPVDHNLIQNYCFIDGKAPWKFFHNDRQGTFTLSTDNPYAGEYSAKIRIKAAGHNVQLYQNGISLEPNTPYELAFAAYSDDGRDMRFSLHNTDGAHTNYGLSGQRVNLEPYWKWFTVTFTTPNLSDLSDARLRFWFAPFARAGTVYHIDRVLLRPISTVDDY